MWSTLSAAVPAYVGADLTDRYSEQCRAIDVCGLTPDGNAGLRATFWHWHWDRAPQPLEVTAIADEVRATRVVMFDGPQALARKGCSLRECERQSAAVGKTPDTFPSLKKPFGGFICSSLDLFTALRRDGIAVSPHQFMAGVSEVYPGQIWTMLSGERPLPRKSTEAGRRVRKSILELLGISGLPILPSHDQNDACVGAMVAAAADHHISGVSVKWLGAPFSVDVDGIPREGPMVIPELTNAVEDRIACAIRANRVFEPPPQLATGRVSVPAEVSADELLDVLIAKAVEGDPQVCTYAWAYRVLFNASYSRFSQAYSRQVIDIACRTRPRQLPGLGLVRLDAFIVSKKDRFPSNGYWPAAHHDREEWERVLGHASLLD